MGHPEKIHLSWQDVDERAKALASKLQTGRRIYGIPRGGVHAAAALLRHLDHSILVEKPEHASLFVDDVVDTGSTRDRYADWFRQTPFVALVEKGDGLCQPWYTFPWERMQDEQGPEENVRRILEYIGEDPNREGLLETPHRVVKSWGELFSGYQVKNPGDILKTFIDGACDELVILKNIAFTSFCEHHILPFTGVACLAYLPDRRVVGVSKLVRLLEVFTRRLQIQERIGQQVVGVLMEELKPKGAACIIQAQHECMSCRGVNKSGCVMVTSALRGAFLENASARAELMQMCGI